MSSSPLSSTAASATGSGLPADAAGSPDPYLPGHGTDAYRVTRYELELDYKLSSNRLNGRAVLHAVAATPDVGHRAGPDRAACHQDPARTGVGCGGSASAPTSSSSSPKPPSCRARNSPWTSATRETPPPAAGLWGEVGWEELTDGVLVAGQPNGAPSWFPCNDHPRDKASYRIAVTTDANYRAVCNGILVSHTTPVQPRDLGLRAVRADGHLPRHGPDRPLRAPDAQPGPPGGTGAPVCGRPGGAGRDGPRRAGAGSRR